MRDFFYTKKFKILLAVAVVLAGMMAWAGANGRLTNAPQEIMGALLTPVQKAARLFSGGLDGLLDKYVRIDQIIAENEQLQQENQELRDQLVDYDQLAAENKAFRDLLNIREENPEFQYASAFVISRDPLDRFGGFTIDQGTLNGVEKGDVVVSDKGYLVGRVLEADLNSSKVMTILQPGSYVACLVSRTRDSGNLNGSADYAADGMCVLENLPRDTLAMVGDEIITTGLGGEFPANIRVGTILELLPENSGTSTIAVVEPGADINKLTHVFIVTDVSAGE
ncbi:MAG TPA: rod shape-determining protein MreC [Candidatus Fournierella merdipullorum]|uniref:Cell shape-determining protein MreC n=1 Tax=Candidatus Allofournierella merdipullorum TaxID=2838595 RepID=A0A9D2E662_9FIRM|nr:rod shape-determining protein MreC [Candidatus Fournierella merdipullorum]